MAAAISLELALYSCWKDQMLRESGRHREIQGLGEGKPNGDLPEGLGTGLPIARYSFGWQKDQNIVQRQRGGSTSSLLEMQMQTERYLQVLSS